MRKVFLSLVAVLLCGVTFAQQQPQFDGGTGTSTNPYLISTPAHFKAIDDLTSTSNTYFKLTKNLDLGTYNATSNDFVIDNTFSGTFDGDNYTITYQASFTASSNQKIGLFRTVSGTITNLNLDADITVSGDEAATVRIGLLCGELNNGGTIEFCDVTGNINSTVKSGSVGNASTGLIIGNNFGDLQYCTGHGNVTGIGYVGGLVGSMGMPIYNEPNNGMTPLIKGCYFTGNVTANNSNSLNFDIFGIVTVNLQSFAGGICGIIMSPARIELCVAEAIVVVGAHGAGIANSEVPTGRFGDYQYDGTAENNYCTGTVNGKIVNENNDNIFAGNNRENNLYSTNPEDLQEIVNNLNGQRGEDADKFYFAIINGKVVLVIGQPVVTPTYICDAPINLTVSVGDFNEERTERVFYVSWRTNNQDASVNETTFRYNLTNNGETVDSGTTTDTIASGTLPTKATPYTLTIESDCSASQTGLYSDAISYTFYVDANCEAVSALQVTNITTEAANVSWVGDADTIKLNGSAITFTNGQTLALTELTPATEYTIKAIKNCTRHDEEGNEVPYQLSTTVTFVTEATEYVTAQSGNFNLHSTWVGGRVPSGSEGSTITIRDGHKVYLDITLVLEGTIINKGVLVIPTDRGQLINKTGNNDLGIVEIETGNKSNGEWTFIGAPFENGYLLGTILPVTGSDISVSKYDYDSTKWDYEWADVETVMNAGEGYFAWPFYTGPVTYTTYGDVCKWNTQTQTYEVFPYDFTKTPATKLNNADEITFTEENLQGNANTGRWMALSNPYPAKLSVSKFVNDNDNANIAEGTEGDIQGKCIYKFNHPTWDVVFANNTETVKDIEITEGFFVNLASGYSVKFKKEQLTAYPPTTPLKASANEFIELTLVNGNEKVRVYFAHNEEAEQGYDIFDANKMFATTGVAEPYFVTDGIALIKEEVAELPYYATMNVRSQEDTVMNFVLTNLPEGYAVSIIDGEEVIDLVEGGVYSTEIFSGENADRFKVLVKKNVGLADVKELDVTITNNNRQVNITADEAVRTEVYNILGQKVFESNDTTFVLSDVASGAYVVKVFGASASKTQKIVVE